jgi:hypothetical protein
MKIDEITHKIENNMHDHFFSEHAEIFKLNCEFVNLDYSSVHALRKRLNRKIIVFGCVHCDTEIYLCRNIYDTNDTKKQAVLYANNCLKYWENMQSTVPFLHAMTYDPWGDAVYVEFKCILPASVDIQSLMISEFENREIDSSGVHQGGGRAWQYDFYLEKIPSMLEKAEFIFLCLNYADDLGCLITR